MRDAISKVRQQFGRHYPLLIAGNPVETAGSLNSVNPAQPDQLIGTVAAGGKEDAVAAVQAAPKAFPRGGRPSAEERARFLDPGADPPQQNPTQPAAWPGFESRKNRNPTE